MNDYDTPEIRCSLRNLSRVTEWGRYINVRVYCLRKPTTSPTCIRAKDRKKHFILLLPRSTPAYSLEFCLSETIGQWEYSYFWHLLN